MTDYAHRKQPMTPFQERIGRMTVQVMTGMNNVAFRLSEGRVGGHVPSGAPICLITTTGRKSGRQRTVPLLFLWDEERMAIVASNGGSSRPPAWFFNLRDDPRLDVSVSDWRQARTARLADDDERARLWPRLVEGYLHFEHYQIRTDRIIPIVILVPSGPRRPARCVARANQP